MHGETFNGSINTVVIALRKLCQLRICEFVILHGSHVALPASITAEFSVRTDYEATGITAYNLLP